MVRGLVCLDVGASTGGFTDCFAANTAPGNVVRGVDVGHNQIDWRLRQDPRVEVRGRCETRAILSRKNSRPGFDSGRYGCFLYISHEGVACGRPFVCAKMVRLITLIKPQFEWLVAVKLAGGGGIVRDPEETLPRYH